MNLNSFSKRASKVVPIGLLLLFIVLRISSVTKAARLNVGLLEASHVPAWQVIGSGETYRIAEWRRVLLSRVIHNNSINDPALWWGWGLYLYSQGQTEEALSTWRTAGIDPGVVAKTQGHYASSLGYPSKALEWYSLAVEIDPELANIWHEMGVLHEDGGQFDRAREAYANAVELGNAASVHSLATLWREQSNHKEAVRIWQSALTAYPAHEERLRWWRGLCNSLRGMADWPAVLSATEYAIQEFPGDAQLHVERGYALYYGSNDHEASIAHFQRAIVLDENMAVAYAAIGELSVIEGRYTLAIDYLSQAIERDPSNRAWHVERAGAALQKGDLEKSLQYFDDVVELWPEAAYPYYRRALVLQLLGRPHDAIASIETAIDLVASPVPQYYVRAASLYEEIGNETSALRAYEAALRISPENEAAREGIRRMNSAVVD
jgi:tetratricopeptide (TPR) repeat protein